MTSQRTWKKPTVKLSRPSALSLSILQIACFISSSSKGLSKLAIDTRDESYFFLQEC